MTDIRPRIIGNRIERVTHPVFAPGSAAVHRIVLVEVVRCSNEFAFPIVLIERDDSVGIALFPALTFVVEIGLLVIVVSIKSLVTPARAFRVSLDPFGGVITAAVEFDLLGVFAVVTTVLLRPIDVMNSGHGRPGHLFQSAIPMVSLNPCASVRIGGCALQLVVAHALGKTGHPVERIALADETAKYIILGLRKRDDGGAVGADALCRQHPSGSVENVRGFDAARSAEKSGLRHLAFEAVMIECRRGAVLVHHAHRAATIEGVEIGPAGKVHDMVVLLERVVRFVGVDFLSQDRRGRLSVLDQFGGAGKQLAQGVVVYGFGMGAVQNDQVCG